MAIYDLIKVTKSKINNIMTVKMLCNVCVDYIAVIIVR